MSSSCPPNLDAGTWPGIFGSMTAVDRTMSEDAEKKPPTKPRWRRWAREAAITAAFVGVLLSAKSTLADHYRVPSGSMLPTIEIGDRIIVNKAAYGLRVPFTHEAITEFTGP